MGILTLVFSHMLRENIEHYPAFVLAGILPWFFFSNTIEGSVHTFSTNAPLFNQIRVPKYLFILSLSFSNAYDFIVALIPYFIISIAIGNPITWSLLLIPLYLLLLLIFIIGVALTLATLNVRFRDISYLTKIGLRGLYFLSPVLYPMDVLPDTTRTILRINPLAIFIDSFRQILYHGTSPSLTTLATLFLTALLTLYIGYRIFLRFDAKICYMV